MLETKSIPIFDKQCYTTVMSYDVGTHIDLSHLNRKRGAAESAEKKSNFQQAVTNAYEVGTQIIFNKDAKAARRIPVVYA